MFAISVFLEGEEIWEEFSTEDEAEARVDELLRETEADEAVVYELSDDDVWESITHHRIVPIA